MPKHAVQLEMFPKVKRSQDERQKLVEFWISEIEGCIRSNDFQRDFFESVAAQFWDKNTVSDKQFEALRRIYERVTQ